MIFALVATLLACEEKETPFYEGVTYLSFATDISQDSTEVSFFFYPWIRYLMRRKIATRCLKIRCSGRDWLLIRFM